MNIFSTIIFLVLLFGGVVFGQLMLSRLPSKWPGLMLPVVSVLFALFTTMLGTVVEGTLTELMLQMAYNFLLANIPTVILVIIYVICRKKYKKKAEMEKMALQDLEEL